MNENELIKRCLIDSDAIVTYPFCDSKHKKFPVLRHKSNNKWFGLIFRLDGTLYINLKAQPQTIFALQDQYPDIITPAWHMNKTHWCKIDVEKINPKTLDAIIKISYDLTAKKK